MIFVIRVSSIGYYGPLYGELLMNWFPKLIYKTCGVKPISKSLCMMKTFTYLVDLHIQFILYKQTAVPDAVLPNQLHHFYVSHSKNM